MADGEEAPAFFGNDALDEPEAVSRVRAPADARPYDDDDDTSFCFASRYVPDEEDDPASLGGSELKCAFKELHALIDRHFGNNTSMDDMVMAVHDFYESRIRSHWDYGVWSRKSIYEYLMHHSAASDERQSGEGIKIVWRNIEFLRDHVGVRDDASGKVTPDLRVMKCLGDMIKLHASLVTEKRKRPRNAA